MKYKMLKVQKCKQLLNGILLDFVLVSLPLKVARPQVAVQLYIFSVLGKDSQ